MSQHLLNSGQVLLGRYKIERFLAEGGMQQVYVANDSSFTRKVAIKVPKNLSAEKRFTRSAQVSARITHANLAKTLDYFEEKDQLFLVEELIDGHDLDASLRDTFSYFDPHLASHFVHVFVRGIAVAHHAGVVHRDLKPSNIMVSVDANIKTVKITDFGIAKMAEAEIEEAVENGTTSISGSQTAMGTLPYMAPEMIEDAKNAGKPADIWAVGAILYRLVSGEFPFGTGLRAVKTILEAKLPAKPQILTEKLQFAALGEDLWRIISACLKKEPSERPTADQLLMTCSGLCYSEAPRFIGTVTEPRAGRGRFGYLVDSKMRRYFYHEDSCYGNLPKSGSKVLLSAYPGHPYPRAFPLLTLK